MSEKESRKEDLVGVYISQVGSEASSEVIKRLNRAVYRISSDRMLGSTLLHSSFAYNANTDSFYMVWSIGPEESTESSEELDRSQKSGVGVFDTLKAVAHKVLEELREQNEGEARAMLDSCMAEINDTRKRMQKDQEDIDRLTFEARTILTQLQTV